MNISEILRALLDKLDQIESSDTLSIDGDPVSDEKQPKMMPPLTQKNELLKKAVGVDSEYDSEEEPEIDSSCGCDDSSMDDELAAMKKRAGIIVMSGDEPLDL